MKQSSLLPSSPIALRMAAIMHRKSSTPWNLRKEIKPFRALSRAISEEDLALVERYYARNWPPRTGVNHLRHDLATLINNWQGEVDRAQIWSEKHPIVAIRKIIPLPLPAVSDPPLVTDDPAQVEKFLADFALRRGRALSKPA